MGEITQLLAHARDGNSQSMHEVFSHLYPELKRIANAQLNAGERTLTPTVLIHEAYVRLIGNRSLALNDRRHFLACAARAMRAIWVDKVRRSTAVKRGGLEAREPIEAAEFVAGDDQLSVDYLALDQSLDRLDAINPRQREVVELRFFTGLEFAEIAELLDCSERTAKREWERARAFLYAQMMSA